MVKPYKRPSYRFYDKEKYLDFQNKLKGEDKHDKKTNIQVSRG